MRNSDERLTDLEVKLSFTEEAVEQLNQVVIRQQRQIELLAQELALLRERADNAAQPRSLREELPPHY